jgi:hypothetical protein
MPRSFLPLAILLASVAGAQSTEPANGIAAQPPAGVKTGVAGGGDPNKQVCRRITKPGSLVSRTQRICMTKQEWDEQAKLYEQQAGDSGSSRSQSQCSGSYGSGDYGSGAC